MTGKTSSHAARTLRAAVISVAAVAATALGAIAAPTDTLKEAAAPGPVQATTAHGVDGAQISPPTKSQVAIKPLWAELNPAQQQALAPLAGEWDKMDGFRKKKWLAIGNKYASMKPDEQQRVQERMRDWVKLTPEQRRIARESYARAKKLGPDKKSEEWERYQQLPDEQKKKLAEAAASRKKVTTLPSPSAQSATSKTIPPIKSAHKPVLEQSVTPQATTQSAIPAATQPSK
ncbi:DUF3106 domain-containing protein [Noviherbaspirillum sp. Root189]|uniref:DUF3106 domain-containing protein n=1 Tax=Noviherbaspirillum sp. Root189 TaxID=1736487 RepID=UPI00070E6626|nr:DUF3106 domain-containing protein [Noviherbaspirillum sp. Root189]KRB84587.1 hypothetical protein ASE07_04100 [Noviherbaspirillum sp. Root189]